MNYEVTIAIPVYNVAPYVKRCLDSVLGQVLDGPIRIELLIIDDCSSDGSMDVVEGVLAATQSPFGIRIIKHGSNKGLAEARNTAIREARGEYVWFVDSDDYVAPEMLRLMLRSLDTMTDVVMCNVATVGTLGEKVNIGILTSAEATLSGLETLELLYERKVYAFMWNKLIRRSLYDGLVFPAGRVYEDLALMGAIFLRARKVVQISEVLYYYVIRGDSITSAYRENIINLIENVNYGISLVGLVQPDLSRSPMVQEYVVRAAWIPVINSIAKASLPYSSTLNSLRFLQKEITLNALLKLGRGGYFIPLAVAMAIRWFPRTYIIAYRQLILKKKNKRMYS